MSKMPILLTGLAALALATAPALAKENRAEEAHEKPIALSQVPKAAVDAAQRALGGNITKAEIISGKSRVYELSSTDASGKGKAVHVTAAGKILKTETEDHD
ncbi:MAG: PepSY domain-containing protein [Caulobacteraceae bacterium]|nr:PepSY domain-containing protein [Caulobacteraceae bacterium]